MDRSKTPPFLLRLFYRLNEHNPVTLFSSTSTPQTELLIYAWPDTFLRELAELVKDVVEEAKIKNAKLGFRLVYLDKLGTPAFVDLGIVSNTTRGYVDTRTLSHLKFQTGDFVDVAVYT
jgi:hypothetical protein